MKLAKWDGPPLLIPQNLKVMKLTFFLLTAAFLQVSANALSQTISISGKDLPLETIFKEIKKQSGYVVFYNYELIKDAKLVTIAIKNATVQEVMNLSLKNQPLSYSIENRTIVLTRKPVTPGDNDSQNNLSLPIDVKGRVVNEKEEPVEGATVTVKGTKTMTATDANGEFELRNIEGNAVLSFSGVNTEPLEVNVVGKTELLITLKTKVSALGEVQVTVNTGYEKIKPQNFVGSYSQLDSAAFHRRTGMNIINRLDGNVTGVLFDKKSGKGVLQTLQVRGLSTLTGLTQSASNEPLIIVDNFPFRQDLSAINPNDVESVSVLRDAAAASIWGAQAGNGVIVITTKRGKYNQPLTISVSSNITIQGKPDLYYSPQMSVAEFVDAEIFLFNKGAYNADLANVSSWPVISPVVEVLAKRRAGSISSLDSMEQIDAYKSLDVRRDMDKYVYRRGVLQQHYVSLSAGNNVLSYNMSAGYNRTLNNIKRSRPDDQLTLKTNAEFRPIKNLEISAGIDYSQVANRSAGFSLQGKQAPYTRLADAEGHILAVPLSRRMGYVDTVGAGNLLDWWYRPLNEIGFSDNNQTARLIQLNTRVAYRFTSWLNANVSYQYTTQLLEAKNYHSTHTYFTRDLINQYTNLSQSNPNLRNPVPLGGILDVSHTTGKTQNIRGQLNFNKIIASKHSITSLVAAEISEGSSSGDQTRFYGYDESNGSYKTTIDYATSFPMYGGFGSRQIPNGSSITPSGMLRFVSFLGNVSYSYDGKYAFYASARKDGSNLFGVNTNRKWKPLWSAGGSWNISKEKFYRIKWLPSLRLRTSFGYTGNPGNATGVATITYNGAPAPRTNLPIALLNEAPNPDLRWEKVRIINVGLDFSLFNNRLSGSIEAYQKKSTDIIAATSFAPSTGVSAFIINTANLRANGFDININSKNIVGVFSWQTSFGLSHAKTIVTKLHANSSAYNAERFISHGQNALEGQIVYGMASYRWAGLDPLTGDPRGYLNKQISTNYAAIFNDTVGNQLFHGSSIPLYFGFINNSFSWKRFTLSANISYRLDFYFRRPTISYGALTAFWQGHADYSLRWQKPGDEQYTTVPSFTFPQDPYRDQFYQYSEVTVQRGDNIRLQDIRLQYDWSNRDTRKLPFKTLQLFFYANNLNLVLWQKSKSGVDPDFEGGASFINPTPVSLTTGFTLGF
jgi:TonB-linked SusC/RagA family outer membrane protein